MRRPLLFLPLVLLVATGAYATTLSSVILRAASDTTGGDFVGTSFLETDPADGEPGVSGTFSTPFLDGSGFGVATGSSNHVDDTLEATAHAQKTAGTAPSLHRARGYADQSGRYTASGAGVVTARFQIEGSFDVLTDRADPSSLVWLHAGFDLDAPGESFSERFSTLDPLNPLFGDTSGIFSEEFSVTFSVDDGDAFWFFPEVLVFAGDDFGQANTEPSLSSFFDASADIRASFSFDSVDVTIIGGDPDQPPVVPLPAGFPLLLAGLAALGVTRARQVRQPAPK